MEREHPTFNVYKGLQKPLIFKGLKGKFIYIGAGCAIGALLSSVIISNIISYTWGGITLCIVMFGGLSLTVHLQKKDCTKRTKAKASI